MHYTPYGMSYVLSPPGIQGSRLIPEAGLRFSVLCLRTRARVRRSYHRTARFEIGYVPRIQPPGIPGTGRSALNEQRKRTCITALACVWMDAVPIGVAP